MMQIFKFPHKSLLMAKRKLDRQRRGKIDHGGELAEQETFLMLAEIREGFS